MQQGLAQEVGIQVCGAAGGSGRRMRGGLQGPGPHWAHCTGTLPGLTLCDACRMPLESSRLGRTRTSSSGELHSGFCISLDPHSHVQPFVEHAGLPIFISAITSAMLKSMTNTHQSSWSSSNDTSKCREFPKICTPLKVLSCNLDQYTQGSNCPLLGPALQPHQSSC